LGRCRRLLMATGNREKGKRQGEKRQRSWPSPSQENWGLTIRMLRGTASFVQSQGWAGAEKEKRDYKRRF